MLTDAERDAIESYLERPLIYNPIEELNAVYSAMVKKGKWNAFYTERFNEWYVTAWLDEDEDEDSMFTAWLFCLNAPEQIEEQMKMVCEFIDPSPSN